MKKLILLLTILIGTLTARAADYSYLTFETTDGEKVSVATASLTITLSGTTLTAGSQSFVLTNLSKMYFSATDETTTGIDTLTADDLDEITDIYDLSGRKVPQDGLQAGVYVVRSKNGTHKIAVKK